MFERNLVSQSPNSSTPWQPNHLPDRLSCTSSQNLQQIRRNYVNIITCGKQFQLQWLTMDEALALCSRGASIWPFASNDGGDEPDVHSARMSGRS